MTSESIPSVGASGFRVCTQEEEEELNKLDAEHDQNLTYLANHYDRLVSDRRGKFALVYCDHEGATRILIDDDLRRLRASIDEDQLPSSIIESLDDKIELSVPAAFLDFD